MNQNNRVNEDHFQTTDAIEFDKIDDGWDKNNLKNFFNDVKTIYLDWRRFEQLYVIEECEAKYIHPRYSNFFYDLMRILQEHLIIKISTLHDPAVSRNYKNICLDTTINIIEISEDLEFKNEVISIKKKLEEIFSKTKIKDYRNKYISHNDVKRNQRFEIFKSEDINDYFETLKKLCNIIYKEFNKETEISNIFIDDHWLDSDSTISDVIDVTKHLKK